MFAKLNATGDSSSSQSMESRLPLPRVVLDDHEDVEIRVVVEPVEIDADGTEPDQRDRVATRAREHCAEVVQPTYQPFRDARARHWFDAAGERRPSSPARVPLLTYAPTPCATAWRLSCSCNDISSSCVVGFGFRSKTTFFTVPVKAYGALSS